MKQKCQRPCLWSAFKTKVMVRNDPDFSHLATWFLVQTQVKIMVSLEREVNW